MAHEYRGLAPAGVRRLVEAHYSDVYAYCRRHTESVDEAEDAMAARFESDHARLLTPIMSI